MNVKIRILEAVDVLVMAVAFDAAGPSKTVEQFPRCLREQEAWAQQPLVSAVAGAFAGYLTVG